MSISIDTRDKLENTETDGERLARIQQHGRKAKRGTPGERSGRPTRDPSRTLSPERLRGVYGGPGEYDRLIYGHGHVQEGVLNIREATSSADTELELPEDATPEEEAFRDEAWLFLQDAVTDFDRGTGSWSSILADAADAWMYGFRLFEPTWYKDEGAYRGHRLELFPIHASTVYSWPVDKQGRPTGVMQQTEYGVVTLPIEDVIHHVHRGSEGPEGVSILRPLVGIFNIWKATMFQVSQRRGIESGAVTIKTPLGVDELSARAVLEMVEDFGAGETKIISHPENFDVQIHFPSNSASQVVPFMEYLDKQIDNVLNRQLSALGYAQHGSRALGEEMREESGWRSRTRLDTMLADFGVVLLRWLADQLGYRGRLPTLVSLDGDEVSDAEKLQRLGLARSQGLIDGVPVQLGESDGELVRGWLALPSDGGESLPVTGEVQPGEGGGEDKGPRLLALSDEDVAGYPGEGRIVVEDCTGRPYWSPRELRGAEQWVAWADNFDDRAALDKKMTAQIAELAQAQRARLWEYLADGVLDASEVLKIRLEFGDQYFDIIRAYHRDIAKSVFSAAAAERGRQTGIFGRSPSGGVDPSDSTALERFIEQYERQVLAQSSVASDVITSRVTNEVQTQFATSQPQDGESFKKYTKRMQESGTRITDEGLVRDVRAIGNRAESVERVRYAKMNPEGMVVHQVVRVTINDVRRCEWCTEHDTETYDFVEDPETEPRPLPDKDCEGGAERCRCGYLIVWGKPIAGRTIETIGS